MSKDINSNQISNPLTKGYSFSAESDTIQIYSTYPYSTFEKADSKIYCIKCKKKTDYIIKNTFKNIINCIECNNLYIQNIQPKKIKYIKQTKSKKKLNIWSWFLSKLYCCIKSKKIDNII